MRFNKFLENALNESISSFKIDGKADIFLNGFFRAKKIGKRDRIWISERFYYYFRRKLLFDELVENSLDKAKCVAMIFENEPDDSISEKIKILKSNGSYERLFNESFPKFLIDKINESYGEAAFSWFNEKALVVLRANLQKITRKELCDKLKEKGYEVEPTSISPAGIEIMPNFLSLKNLPLFKMGFFEFQDESTQIASLLINKNFKTLLDGCAGSGGKSLAAASFFPKMEIVASDKRTFLFKEIKNRAKRANAKIKTELFQSIKTKRFDSVLVDAPCSGSGVLRRNPADRWQINEEKLKETTDLQTSLMSRFSKLVKIDGELIYLTCSFLKEENEEIIQKFLNKNGDFEIVSAKERIFDNLNGQTVPQTIFSEDFLRFCPFSNRDLIFGAILKRRH